MRHNAVVHSDRVVIPSYGYSSGPSGDIEIPRDLLDALTDYKVSDVKDAFGALRWIKHHPHYWTTAGELANRQITESLIVIWYEANYEDSTWNSSEVVSVQRDSVETIWLYADTEQYKATYLDPDYEYREDYLDFTEEDWLDLARCCWSFSDDSPLLVLEPHPTLF